MIINNKQWRKIKNDIEEYKLKYNMRKTIDNKK